MENTNLIKKKTKFGLFSKPEFGVFAALLVLIILFSLTCETFLTSKNILNIIRQISFKGVLAMGMVMVMTCGDIDLSVGATYYLAAAVAAFTMTAGGLPIWLSIVIALALGTLAGLANGALVSYVKLPAFIATLGIQNIVRGSALLLTDGFTITLNKTSVADPGLETFKFMGSGKVFDVIPMMAIVFAVIAVIAYFIYHKTILGFRFRAVGCNRDAAVAAGVNAKAVRIVAFTITGFLAALAGVFMAAFLNNVQANIGDGMELEAIAPCIIGGTSVNGGKGSVIGAIIGCLILGVLGNGLVLLGVSSYVQVVLEGAVIIGAVTLDLVTKKGK